MKIFNTLCKFGLVTSTKLSYFPHLELSATRAHSHNKFQANQAHQLAQQESVWEDSGGVAQFCRINQFA